jgi:hypothetical protein
VYRYALFAKKGDRTWERLMKLRSKVSKLEPKIIADVRNEKIRFRVQYRYSAMVR